MKPRYFRHRMCQRRETRQIAIKKHCHLPIKVTLAQGDQGQAQAQAKLVGNLAIGCQTRAEQGLGVVAPIAGAVAEAVAGIGDLAPGLKWRCGSPASAAARTAQTPPACCGGGRASCAARWSKTPGCARSARQSRRRTRSESRRSPARSPAACPQPSGRSPESPCGRPGLGRSDAAGAGQTAQTAAWHHRPIDASTAPARQRPR